MKEALFYKKLKSGIVQCQLCPHFCALKDKERGECNVRENQKGKLISLNYGKPCSLALDPIEKKPLYHFLPGQEALSIATASCNLACKNCQNWEISQGVFEKIPNMDVSPAKVIKEAQKFKVRIISYTYTEPTIFYEYMQDISKLAKKKKIKDTIVSNGFINEEPLIRLCKVIDGANIDLKSMDDEFYRKICKAKLEPVLKSLKILKDKGVWLEITNLLIPGLNDSVKDINKLVKFIVDELGYDVPVHFTAFYPTYRMNKISPTSIEILKKARKIAMKAGINYVYTGNLPDDEGNNTYCPSCKEVVIRRTGFKVIKNNLIEGKCRCGQKIAGIWK